MTPNKLKQLWAAGQADDQRLVFDRQRLHCGDHGRAGLRLRHRRRAARRARLFEPVADVAGHARFRRRSDGARAVAGAGHHHEGARRRRLRDHLPDGEQRRAGGGVRQLHALPAARAAQLRADARLVAAGADYGAEANERNAGLRDDRDRRGHGESRRRSPRRRASTASMSGPPISLSASRRAASRRASTARSPR